MGKERRKSGIVKERVYNTVGNTWFSRSEFVWVSFRPKECTVKATKKTKREKDGKVVKRIVVSQNYQNGIRDFIKEVVH